MYNHFAKVAFNLLDWEIADIRSLFERWSMQLGTTQKVPLHRPCAGLAKPNSQMYYNISAIGSKCWCHFERHSLHWTANHACTKSTHLKGTGNYCPTCDHGHSLKSTARIICHRVNRRHTANCAYDDRRLLMAATFKQVGGRASELHVHGDQKISSIC